MGDRKRIYTSRSSQHELVGCIYIRVPVSDSFSPSFYDGVVDVGVPLLVGLDFLTPSRLVLDYADDEVRSKTDGWCIPLIGKNGHAYLF